MSISHKRKHKWPINMKTPSTALVIRKVQITLTRLAKHEVLATMWSNSNCHMQMVSVKLIKQFGKPSSIIFKAEWVLSLMTLLIILR